MPIRRVLLSGHAFRFPSWPARQINQAGTAVVRPTCGKPLGLLIGLTKIAAFNLAHGRLSVHQNSTLGLRDGQPKIGQRACPVLPARFPINVVNNATPIHAAGGSGTTGLSSISSTFAAKELSMKAGWLTWPILKARPTRPAASAWACGRGHCRASCAGGVADGLVDSD